MLNQPRKRFTGHGCRRGGATHVFKVLRSYDEVQRLGRWQDQATCRSCIHEAVADTFALFLPAVGRQVVHDGVKSFPVAAKQMVSNLVRQSRGS